MEITEKTIGKFPDNSIGETLIGKRMSGIHKKIRWNSTDKIRMASWGGVAVAIIIIWFIGL